MGILDLELRRKENIEFGILNLEPFLVIPNLIWNPVFTGETRDSGFRFKPGMTSLEVFLFVVFCFKSLKFKIVPDINQIVFMPSTIFFSSGSLLIYPLHTL
ncbi:MAG: hypothetical protein UT66_C0046G0004 [candidate division CPR2 bacterium GW2011_GWC1_39_9]|nr:MAG: hypothetical protein UT66_C0046G0004 [candidate division CPR2 bacterium GW2011_GWC1_39_9]